MVAGPAMGMGARARGEGRGERGGRGGSAGAGGPRQLRLLRSLPRMGGRGRRRRRGGRARRADLPLRLGEASIPNQYAQAALLLLAAPGQRHSPIAAAQERQQRGGEGDRGASQPPPLQSRPLQMGSLRKLAKSIHK